MALPIERLNERFDGEFQFKRKTFTVPFTLPGDLVQFQLRFRGPKHERFKVLHIERAERYAPDVELARPFCAYHGQCGGCRAQHLAYSFQLTLKCDPVRARMEQLTGLRPQTIQAPEVSGHRNRMDFVVNGADCGLRPVGDFANFVDIAECAIQRPGANAALALVRELLADPALRGAAWRRADFSGALKYVTIRQGHESGVIVLTVHGAARELPAYVAWRKALVERIAAARAGAAAGPLSGYSVVECVSEAETAEVSNLPGGQVLIGNDTFRERLGGLDFTVPYDAFFQPNPAGFDRLLETCRPWLDAALSAPAPGDALIDLYSGAGILSAIVARWFPGRFGLIRGYESTASAVERAPQNFRDAGIDRADGPAIDFEVVDLDRPPADFLAGFAAGTGADPVRTGAHRAALVVLDPPRAGLSAAVRAALVQHRPAPVLLYISCNPYSQLRDLGELQAAYEVKQAALVDCYPQTPHLEQAVLLARRN